MKKFNYYEQTKELFSLLEQEGKHKEVDILKEAIAQGSTGTEIIMCLQYCLKTIIELGGMSPITEHKAIYIFKEIDNFLKK